MMGGYEGRTLCKFIRVSVCGLTVKQYNQKKIFFTCKLGLEVYEENTEVLHLEHSFLWCCDLVTWGSRSEILGKV